MTIVIGRGGQEFTKALTESHLGSTNEYCWNIDEFVILGTDELFMKYYTIASSLNTAQSLDLKY